jgi:hypothetical protein
LRKARRGKREERKTKRKREKKRRSKHKKKRGGADRGARFFVRIAMCI